MKCPFPGMDPYVERRAIWPDFHNRLISHLGEALQPNLRPRYAALTQDRLYVVEHERAIYPDVSVIELPNDETFGTSDAQTSTAIAAIPTVELELALEEVRQPVLHIIEPAAGNRIVTAIEVLSPDNKANGQGRDSYLEKHDELWQAGANLVEIDLLRDGIRNLRLADAEIAKLPRWHYAITVTRRHPSRYQVFTIQLADRLPRIPVPLGRGDTDAVADLQAVFDRCWQAGPYPELLQYDQTAPGTLTEDESKWCQDIAANFKPIA